MVRIPEASRRLQQYPHELSGGMRQRVMIAVALSCSPKLVIADEPTTALDVTVQKQILDLMATLQRDLGTSMILITHDLGVVAGRTDRVAVMYAGQIVELAGTEALFSSMAHPYTDALLQSIPRIESSSAVRLQTIEGRPPSMIHPPAGCRFMPRCTRAQEECGTEQPSLEIFEDAHAVACHFPLRVSKSVASRTEGVHP
jgi:peptide/nickel transport system ATP-binding protein